MPADHEILGVRPGASADEIRRAYREKVKQYHPDSAQDEASAAIFVQLVEAYGRLSDGDASGGGGQVQGTSVVWNPPPVRPTPRSHRPAVKRRPRVNDGELSATHDAYGVEFYLGPFQVQVLQTGDLALASRVYERGQPKLETFVLPRGTLHGSILQYAGFKKDRSSSANWFDALIRYHWSVAPPARRNLRVQQWRIDW